MKAVTPDPDPHAPLVWTDTPNPTPTGDELCISVHCAGLNRADLMQRAGHYPPPPGASPILGLEVSGVVSAVGPKVHRYQPGDAVCALLAGGGYAEQVTCPESHVLPVPAGLSPWSKHD